MTTPVDDDLIFSHDVFKDADGLEWRVEAFDVGNRRVRLRLSEPPRRDVDADEFRAKYKLAGIRGFVSELRESAAVAASAEGDQQQGSAKESETTPGPSR
jgi:hypothetical protein